MAEDERRQHPRMRVDGRAAGRATVVAGLRVLSVSEKGASLEADLPLAPGSTCDISLHAMGGQIDIKARVVEVQAANGGYRLAVEFLSVDEPDLALFDSYLARERGERA
jgi:hypothetical protein